MWTIPEKNNKLKGKTLEMYIKRKEYNMIANYYIIDDFSLKIFEGLTFEEKLDKLEEMQDDFENFSFCDINDIWEGLYFLISSEKEPVYTKEDFEKYSKSTFIFGDMDFNTEEYMAYILNNNLQKIMEIIENLDFNYFNFKKEDFIKNEIFPFDIWENEDEESLQELLEMAFDELKNFYKKAIKENKNILITIM